MVFPDGSQITLNFATGGFKSSKNGTTFVELR